MLNTKFNSKTNVLSHLKILIHLTNSINIRGPQKMINESIFQRSNVHGYTCFILNKKYAYPQKFLMRESKRSFNGSVVVCACRNTRCTYVYPYNEQRCQL